MKASSPPLCNTAKPDPYQQYEVISRLGERDSHEDKLDAIWRTVEGRQ